MNSLTDSIFLTMFVPLFSITAPIAAIPLFVPATKGQAGAVRPNAPSGCRNVRNGSCAAGQLRSRITSQNTMPINAKVAADVMSQAAARP